MSDAINEQDLPLNGPAQSAASNDAGPDPELLDSAMYCTASHLRLWLTTVIGLLADLWSKSWAFSTLRLHERQAIIPDVLSFQTSLNQGALFGMGKGIWWMRWVFIVASALAMVFVLYVFSRCPKAQRSFHLGLGMVLGGALGNLYDRLFHNGMVRDFIKIDLKIGPVGYPWIFNIADVLLVVGVGLLLLNIWRDRSRHPAETA